MASFALEGAMQEEYMLTTRFDGMSGDTCYGGWTPMREYLMQRSASAPEEIRGMHSYDS